MFSARGTCTFLFHRLLAWLNLSVVIIGSGAGGAPMAYKLAQAGWRVILLEEGRNNNPASFNRDSWDAMKEMYRDSGMLTTLSTPSIPLPLGITLGGTTVINSGTCFRTPERMFAEWKNRFGLTGLEYNDLLPYFEEAENMIHTQQAPYELLGANNQLFAEGAKKLGMHGRPLMRNAIDCKGAGICVFGCPEGAKQSMRRIFCPLLPSSEFLSLLQQGLKKLLQKIKQLRELKEVY